MRLAVAAFVGAGLALIALIAAACGTPPPQHDPAKTHYVFVGDPPTGAWQHGEWWRSDGGGLTMFCGSLSGFNPVTDHFWKFGNTCTP